MTSVYWQRFLSFCHNACQIDEQMDGQIADSPDHACKYRKDALLFSACEINLHHCDCDRDSYVTKKRRSRPTFNSNRFKILTKMN